MDLANCLGIKQRFSAKRHHSRYIVIRTDLSYGFHGDRSVDMFRESVMITFRAMLAPSCTCHCHDEFDFIQVLYIWIHYAFYSPNSDYSIVHYLKSYNVNAS